jgi:hypothetical protein
MSTSTAINGYSSDLSKVWAFATLIDDYDKVVDDHLSGNLADSAHASRNGARYFLFDNLSIGSVGSFRIRVTLMDNSAADAANLQQAESHRIAVEDREVQRASPSTAPGELSTKRLS